MYSIERPNIKKMAASYVPPSFRNRNTAPPPSTKKTALKKEFAEAFNANAFPSLGDTFKNTQKSRGTPISFSSAAAKKIVQPKIVQAEVPAGWVYIRKHNGIIQYKYGAPVIKQNNEEREDAILSAILFKYRLAREQYDREREIEQLGDLSEFYGEPTLAEIYENDSASLEQVNDYSSESSWDSDIEH